MMDDATAHSEAESSVLLDQLITPGVFVRYPRGQILCGRLSVKVDVEEKRRALF